MLGNFASPATISSKMLTRSSTGVFSAAPTYVDVLLVTDRSGSMITMGGGLLAGCEKFIKEHYDMAKSFNMTDGNYRLRIVSFDNIVEVLYDGNATGFYESKSNSEAIKKGLEPRGTTRLYDTIIEQIDEQTARVDDFKKGLHPSILQLNPRIAVICAVLTDGEDNMSINRSRHVAGKIEAHIKNYEATCQFIAANQNANATGARMGFPVETCLQMDADPEHAAAAMECITSSCVRTISGESPHFLQEERTMSASLVPNWRPNFGPLNEDEDEDESQPLLD